MAACHALPSFQEFSERCMQLHGPARSVDLCPGTGLGWAHAPWKMELGWTLVWPERYWKFQGEIGKVSTYIGSNVLCFDAMLRRRFRIWFWARQFDPSDLVWWTWRLVLSSFRGHHQGHSGKLGNRYFDREFETLELYECSQIAVQHT